MQFQTFPNECTEKVRIDVVVCNMSGVSCNTPVPHVERASRTMVERNETKQWMETALNIFLSKSDHIMLYEIQTS
jgi:hypothetical protein